MLNEAIRATRQKSLVASKGSNVIEKPSKLDRYQFVSISIYMMTQMFMIPIIPIGPSWSVWPRLADFALIILMTTALLSARNGRPSIKCRRLLRYLILCNMVCVSTFLVFNHFHNWEHLALSFGLYQVYRLSQFILIFWAASQVPLTQLQAIKLARIATLVLVMVCMGGIATFFEFIPANALVSHLPDDPYVSGPWSFYRLEVHRGWGAIGYNHAYISAQILLLLGLRFHLSPVRMGLGDGLVVMLAVFAVGISGSRAGLASIMVFVTIFFAQKSARQFLAILIPVILLILTALLITSDKVGITLSEVWERQSTLMDPTNEGNLSGRADIWNDCIEFLNEKPHRWIVGEGFGTAISSGAHAHMLYLHIVLELGVLGLLGFIALAAYILRALWQCESGAGPLFLTTVALLLSALTQETFYPVTALGHFLGLYLFSVAIALGRVVTNVSGKPRTVT